MTSRPAAAPSSVKQRTSRASAARAAALAVLSRARRRKGYGRDLLRAAPEMARLSARDRALAQRLVLGAVASRGILDDVLKKHVKRMASLEPRVHDALRISAFELLYLDTAESAAVSQGVELVRSVSPRAAGLANAVLRKVAAMRAWMGHAREILELDGNMAGCELADVDAAAFAGGLPLWLAQAVDDSCGTPALARLALAELEPAPVWAVANLGQNTDDEAFQKLADAGAEPARTAQPGTFLLGRPGMLGASDLMAEGDVVVSDFAAQAVALVAAPCGDAAVLEVGQGRATKTILMLDDSLRLGARPEVVSLDVSEAKAKLAAARVGKGWEGARSVVLDGRALAGGDLPAPVDRAFDVVLLDAPCSGTGTMRRHPEIPWSLEERSVDPADPEGLPALQLALLKAASSRVAVGGALVYATCSVLKSEDEDVVEAFLASPEGAGFSVASPLDAPAVAAAPEEVRAFVAENLDERGFFKTVPSLEGPDGHFCARLVRA